MSIYRRYVAGQAINLIADGSAGFSAYDAPQIGASHPIYVVVPDEDAPEPPDIDFEREYRRNGKGLDDRVRITTPPALTDNGREWAVIVTDATGTSDYKWLSNLTPIEPAPERMYTAEQVREAKRAEVREALRGWAVKEEAERLASEAADDLLARLEGSDADS